VDWPQAMAAQPPPQTGARKRSGRHQQHRKGRFCTMERGRRRYRLRLRRWHGCGGPRERCQAGRQGRGGQEIAGPQRESNSKEPFRHAAEGREEGADFDRQEVSLCAGPCWGLFRCISDLDAAPDGAALSTTIPAARLECEISPEDEPIFSFPPGRSFCHAEERGLQGSPSGSGS